MVGLTNAQTLWLRSLLAFGRQAQHYVLAKWSLINPIIGPYHQSSVRNKTRVVSKSFFFSFFLSVEYTFRQERINTQTHHTEPIRARSTSLPGRIPGMWLCLELCLLDRTQAPSRSHGPPVFLCACGFKCVGSLPRPSFLDAPRWSLHFCTFLCNSESVYPWRVAVANIIPGLDTESLHSPESHINSDESTI